MAIRAPVGANNITITFLAPQQTTEPIHNMQVGHWKYVFSWSEKHCPPLIIEALGWRTDCIGKQPSTVAVKKLRIFFICSANEFFLGLQPGGGQRKLNKQWCWIRGHYDDDNNSLLTSLVTSNTRALHNNSIREICINPNAVNFIFPRQHICICGIPNVTLSLSSLQIVFSQID